VTTVHDPARPASPARARPRGLPIAAVIAMSVLLAVIIGWGIGTLAGSQAPAVLCLAPLVLVVPVVIWRRPALGLYGILVGTATIEQFAYTVGPRGGAITDRVPFFHSITPGSGVTPCEMLLFLTCAVLVLQRIRDRTPVFPRSRVAACIAVLLGIVTLYVLIGLAKHGSFKITMWEIRPWFYLGATYVLGSAFLSTRRSAMTVLWIYVLGTGAKAIYGITIWLSIRHVSPRPESILAHEESFFFGLFFAIAVGLWVFSIKGRLRTTATILLPFVILADMANTRRTAWAIIGSTILILFAVAYQHLPARRRALRLGAACTVAIAAVYIPAEWSHSGALAQPVRALRSQVAPDARDLQSDQYRKVEDVNLELNIHASRSMGSGFGLPIDYSVPIVNLQSIDSFIAYIPHDGVLYVWMRMGLLGELALLAVIGSALLAAGALTRVEEPLVGLLGTIVVCAVTAYVIMGAQDMGFSWFRIALCLGALLGSVEAAGHWQIGTPSNTEATIG